MGVEDRSRLPVQAASDFEDSKDRDVARERTRPERQNGKLGVQALMSAERVESGNYFRYGAARLIRLSDHRSFNPGRIAIMLSIAWLLCWQAKLVSILVFQHRNGDA